MQPEEQLGEVLVELVGRDRGEVAAALDDGVAAADAVEEQDRARRAGPFRISVI